MSTNGSASLSVVALEIGAIVYAFNYSVFGEGHAQAPVWGEN